MNVFELAFWSFLLWVLFLLARWASGMTGLNQWLVYVIVVIVVLGGMEIAGRLRKRE